MMRLALGALALAFSAAACAPTPAPARTEGTVMPQIDCDVTASFGSFAMGIDRRAAAAIEALVRADPSVTQVTRSPYGIEGEYRLCVGTRSAGDAAKLFERLRQSLREPVRGPVTITGPQGSYSARTR